MHNVQQCVIFEGMDRSGKSSLALEVWKQRNKIDSMIDRFVLSELVYNDFYKRNVKNINLYYLFVPDLVDVVVVYAYCSYETYLKRCKDTGHVILYKEDFIKQQELYLHYLNELKLRKQRTRFFAICTDDESIQSLAKKVKKFIESSGQL